MAESSPFKFYNILLTGITGTDMASFKGVLTEEQLWSVSFYLSSLRFHNAEKTPDPGEIHGLWKLNNTPELSGLIQKGLDKSLLAGSGDRELLSWVSANLDSDQQKNAGSLLKLLRLSAAFHPEVPLESSKKVSQSGTQAVLEGLDYTDEAVLEARELAESGEFAKAEKRLLEGYLMGFQNTEKSLAIVDPLLVTDIEGLFIEVRSLARNGDA